MGVGRTIRVLLWKDIKQIIHGKLMVLTCLFCPLLLLAVFSWSSILENPTHYPDRIFKAYSVDADPTKSTFHKPGDEDTIIYSPCNHEVLMPIMTKVADDFNLRTWCIRNHATLAVEINPENMICGIDFNDEMERKHKSEDLKYIGFRFPNELRNPIYQGELLTVSTWYTNYVYPSDTYAGPRSHTEDSGADPGYIKEQFLHLQNEIMKNVIRKLAKNDDIEFPKIFMKRFPYRSWKVKDRFRETKFQFGVFMAMLFVAPMIFIIREMVTEKQLFVTKLLFLTGVSSFGYHLSILIKSFIILLPANFVAIFVTVQMMFSPNYLLIIVILLLFNVALCFLCAAVGTCFRSDIYSLTAITTIIMVHFIFLDVARRARSWFSIILFSSSCFITLMYGLDVLIETQDDGLSVGLSKAFTKQSTKNMSVGYTIVYLLTDSLLYFLIAKYSESVNPSTFKAPRRWYYPISDIFVFINWNSCWNKVRGLFNLPPIKVVKGFQSTGKIEMYESDPMHLELGLESIKLSKKYGYKQVVNEITLRMFLGEITVILGQCSSGKTSLLKMLAGILRPNSGITFIRGYNILKQYSKIRRKVGMVMEADTFFTNLTIAEHIRLICMLRGTKNINVEDEVNRYTSALLLSEKVNVIVQKLSKDGKRRLAVALALCGNSKYIFMDEPSSALDTASKKALWNLLQQEKNDRLIVLTTQNLEEAEQLGDRIAILINGTLKGYGTSYFLKKQYSSGYYISLTKAEKCRTDVVTRLFRTYLPSAQIITQVGASIKYYVQQENANDVATLLNKLEVNSTKLGILNYQIRVACLEDIFYKICSENVSKTTEQREETVYITQKNIAKGKLLVLSQVAAMFLKRLLLHMKNFDLFILQLILPVVWIVLCMYCLRVHPLVPGKRCFTTKDYMHPIVVVGGSSIYRNAYINACEGTEIIDLEHADFEKELLQRSRDNIYQYRRNYIIGALFEEDKITVYFNNEPYHTPPLALHKVHLAMARVILKDDNWDIEICNDPLIITLASRIKLIAHNGQVLPLHMIVALAVPFSLFSLFYSYEHIRPMRKLKVISGMRLSIVILANIFWDFIVTMYICCTLLMTVMLFKQDGYRMETRLARVYMVMLVFGLCNVIMSYLISFFAKTPISSFMVMLALASFGFFLEMTDLDTLTESIYNVQYIFPYMLFTTCLKVLYGLYLTHSWCQVSVEMCMSKQKVDRHICEESACRTSSECCCIEKYFFSVRQGIGAYLLSYAMIMIVSGIFILLMEKHIFKIIIIRLSKRKMTKMFEKEKDANRKLIGDEVMEENERIEKIDLTTDTDHAVVFKNVTQYFGSRCVLNNINFSVQRGECLGIIGANGTGKSTICKLITAQLYPCLGTVYINKNAGRSKRNPKLHYVGYCPQLGGLIPDFTPKESLVLYGLIKGLPSAILLGLAENYAVYFDFQEYLNCKISSLSLGVQKKIVNALAFIGQPYLLVLDEPTAYMSTPAKMIIWKNIMKARQKGSSIILATTNMEECEAVCSSIGILVNGCIVTTGTIPYLNTKYNDGYSLYLKIYSKEKNERSRNSFHIKKYIQESFEKAILTEDRHSMLRFKIVGKQLWSKIFEVVEEARDYYANVESYNLSLNTLSEVYTVFVKDQKRVSLFQYQD